MIRRTLKQGHFDNGDMDNHNDDLRNFDGDNINENFFSAKNVFNFNDVSYYCGKWSRFCFVCSLFKWVDNTVMIKGNWWWWWWCWWRWWWWEGGWGWWRCQHWWRWLQIWWQQDKKIKKERKKKRWHLITKWENRSKKFLSSFEIVKVDELVDQLRMWCWNQNGNNILRTERKRGSFSSPIS